MASLGPRHRQVISCRRMAAALCATTLAMSLAMSTVFVAPQPAGAAASDVSLERIAGATRYETAAQAAGAWVTARSSGASSSNTALLASGADAHAAIALITPALAHAYQAPLLLTESDRLSAAAAAFLSSRSIDQVVIVGGTQAVSTGVVDDLRELGISEVNRIAGADHYETAAAVAQHVADRFGPPGEFGLRSRTVVIATGEGTADALAIGPFAYQGRHPVLLTRRGTLHPSVASYLRDSGATHAVIIGGEAAVTAATETAIIGLGLTTERWFGEDRYATSARIAAQLMGSGSPVSCFDGTALGIAVGTRAADAAASAPLLGERCAPLLLTEPQRVPAVVRRLLDSEHYLAGGATGRAGITVFGGTAAVSASTADAAVRAATLVPIRARISAVEGRCYFVVEFDEPVDAVAAADASNYRIAGTSVEASEVQLDSDDGRTARRATVVLAGSSSIAAGSVPTRCDRPLQARDEVRITGGVIGAAQGRRTVDGVTAPVARDRQPPRLVVVAPSGAESVWVEAREPIRNLFGEVEFFRRDATPETVVMSADVKEGAFGFEVAVPTEWGQLDRGDRVTVLASAVRDLAGNRSQRASVTARTDSTAPRVSRATVTTPAAAAAATAVIDNASGAPLAAAGLTVAALFGGSAAGAAGNDWELEFEAERSWKASRLAEVDISFSAKRLRIQAPATRPLRSIVADLHTDTAFERHFSARLDTDEGSTSIGIDRDVGPIRFSGGISVVDVAVYWSEAVYGCNTGSDAVSASDIEFDLDADGNAEYAFDGTSASSWGVEVVGIGSAIAPGGSGGSLCSAAGELLGTLHARLRSEQASSLPTVRSRLVVYSGAAVDRAGNSAVSRRGLSLSRG